MHNFRFKKIGFDCFSPDGAIAPLAVLECELKVNQWCKDLTFNLLDELKKELAANFVHYFHNACLQNRPGEGLCTKVLGTTYTQFVTMWDIESLDGYRIEVPKASRYARTDNMRIRITWDPKSLTEEGCRHAEPISHSTPAVNMATQFNYLNSDRASLVLLANREQALFRAHVRTDGKDMLPAEHVSYTLRFNVRLIPTVDSHQSKKTAEAA